MGIFENSQLKPTSFEMNIIIVGNYSPQHLNQIINYDKLSISTKDINGLCYNETKNEKLNWIFSILPQKCTNDEIITGITNLINKNLENQDEFYKQNFRGKNVIYAFIDEKFAKKILEQFKDKLESQTPFFIFINKGEYNENNFSDLKDKMIIHCIKYNEKDILCCIQILLKACSYYNQLGDIINLPKELSLINEDNLELYPNNLSFYKINIIVCGKMGVGKSTLINMILGEKRSFARDGNDCTKKIINYKHQRYPLNIFDTPGYKEEEGHAKMIKNHIEKLQNSLNEEKSKLHLMIYIIDNKPRIFNQDDIDFIKFIYNLDIPIFFIMNFCDEKNKNKYEISIKSFKNVFNRDLKSDSEKNINKFRYLDMSAIKEIIPCDFYSKFNMNKVFNSIYTLYKPSLINENDINDNNKKIGEIEKEFDRLKKLINDSFFFEHLKCINDFITSKNYSANEIIWKYTVCASICGAIPSPIVDLSATSGIQFTMIYSITELYYNVLMNPNALNYIKEQTGISSLNIIEGKNAIVFISIKFIYELIKKSAIQTVTENMASFMKFIPVIGTIIGGIASIFLNGSFTYSLGKNLRDLFEESMKRIPIHEIVGEAAKSYNKAINAFKEIGDMFLKN